MPLLLHSIFYHSLGLRAVSINPLVSTQFNTLRLAPLWHLNGKCLYHHCEVGIPYGKAALLVPMMRWFACLAAY